MRKYRGYFSGMFVMALFLCVISTGTVYANSAKEPKSGDRFMFTDKAISVSLNSYYLTNDPDIIKVTVDNTSTVGGGPFSDVMTILGTVSTGIVLLDLVPEQGTCEIGEGGFTCELGTVNADTQVDVDVIFLAETPGTENISVTVESLSFDPDNSNNTFSTSVEILAPASISGIKYEDLNANGTKDVDEPGIEGWEIALNGDPGGGSIDRNALTDTSGSYIFSQLPPGEYVVIEQDSNGWFHSTPKSFSLSLEAGEGVEDISFGNYERGTIIGYKFEDTNGNGQLDDGEPGIPDWTIELEGQDGLGNPVLTTVQTDSNGAFIFPEVDPGSYTVSEVNQDGWTQSFPDTPGTYSVMLKSGEILDGIDFGNIPPVDPASIHGQKFSDFDGNGQQDPPIDVGLNGVTIELYDNTNTLISSTSTMSMDVNGDGSLDPVTEHGLFWFKDLTPGTYSVKELIPSSWTQTFPQNPDFYTIVLNPGDIYDGALFGNTTEFLDWGDLPQPVDTSMVSACTLLNLPCYPTQRGSGASHGIHLLSPFLGDFVDPDPDGIPTNDALGDDADESQDDEDGVEILNYAPGEMSSVQVKINSGISPVYLTAWVDFDADGVLGDLLCSGYEKVINAKVTVGGTAVTETFNFAVPSEATQTPYARFRVSSDSASIVCPFGMAEDGEVEDYILPGVDFGDAPGSDIIDVPIDIPTGYPTRLAENGARHIFENSTRIGNTVTDSEGNGESSRYANGDDNKQNSDEDGIEFLFDASDGPNNWVTLWNGPDPESDENLILRGVVQGTSVTIRPLATKSGFIDAWVDWNRDGDWVDGEHNDLPEEKVINMEPVESGPDYTEITFSIPPDASIGWTYARFRYTVSGIDDPSGLALTGEVEDYILAVLLPVDYGDAPQPYPTLARDGGARHISNGTYYLGISADFDADGMPDPDALGDDNFGGTDDEDGVSFLTELKAGQTAQVEITATAPADTNGFLSAWIDFNRDGDWKDEGEQIFADVQLSTGTDTLEFEVAPEAMTDTTFARFRFSESKGKGPDDVLEFPGLPLIYTQGEVEDYLVIISMGTGIDEETGVPSEFKLHQNYPNPFNPATVISYQLPVNSSVELKVFDLLGREVAVLVDGQVKAGFHRVTFKADNLSSGMYFYVLKTDNFRATGRMILMK